MIRPRLLEWQWSDYSAKHRDQINLLLHIVAVSRFVAEQWITFSALRLLGRVGAQRRPFAVTLVQPERD